MTDLEALTKLKELLSDKTKWTQGYLAKDIYGEYVSPKDHRAYCFCIEGGLVHVNSDVALPNMSCAEMSKSLPGYGALQRVLEKNQLWYFNDWAEYDDVMKAIDKTIAQLESKVI